MNDLQFARRSLARDPGFFALATLVLALGIGAVATQLSVINGLLIRLPSFPDPERLVIISLYDVGRNRSAGGALTADYFDWREAQRSCAELAMYGARLSINVTIDEVPRRYGGVYVTHTFFRTLGVNPRLGRDFSAEDDQPGAAKTIIISDDVWQSDFGGRADIIGQKVSINGRPGTVIGVMPPGFRYPFSEQVWTPLVAEFQNRVRTDSQVFGGTVLGRLRPGVTRAFATADFSRIAQRMAEQHPQTNRSFTAAQLVPLGESFVAPQMRQTLFLMLAAVVVVLLIACVNVMNMQFARAARRTRDLAVCSALGASRGRLLRQLLVENLTLSLGGAVGGIVFAWWACDLLLRHSRSLPTPPPSWVTFELDWRVVAAVAAVALGAAVVSGLAPALLASRSSPLELMREGGRGSTARRTTAVIRGLVVLQIALTSALLVLATFMIRSTINQQRINWGYDTAAVLAARMTLFQADHPTPAALARFFDRVLETLRSDPHFAEAALTTRFRLAITNSGPYEVEGGVYPGDTARPVAGIEPISDRYFAALGLELVSGRDFNAADTPVAPAVALVNTAFVRRHFPAENPVGRRIRLAQTPTTFGPWITIVGVAPDTHMQGPYDGESDGAGVFLPLAQAPQRWITLVVRGRGGEPLAWAEPLRTAMARLDRNQPIYMINTVEQLIAVTLDRNRLLVSIFMAFGSSAMVLAAVGLYGVMSFAVSQRTNEYGVRMALGAEPRTILTMILQQGATQLALGLGIGLAVALLLVVVARSTLAGFLFRVSHADPLVWGSTVLLISGVALVACLGPAVRAMRVNPVDALRAE